MFGSLSLQVDDYDSIKGYQETVMGLVTRLKVQEMFGREEMILQ
jgi:hypothetical protein